MNALFKQILRKGLVGTMIFGLLLVYGLSPLVPKLASAETELPPETTEEENLPAEDPAEEPLPEEDITEEEPVTEEDEQAKDTEPITEEKSLEEEPAEEEPIIEEEPLEEEPAKETAETEAKDPEPKPAPEEDMTNTPKEVWEQLGPNKYQTTEIVEVGKSYLFPGDNGVELVFSRLPEKAGHLTIEKVSSEFVSEKVGEVVSGVYSITSDMPDGSFAYDIAVRYDQNKTEQPKLFYSEDSHNFSPVSEIDVRENQREVEASLDHFTFFAVIDGAENWWGGTMVLNPIDIAELQDSDDVRMATTFLGWPWTEFNPFRSLEFKFGDVIPAGVTLDSAVLHFEYQRSGAQNWLPHGARLQALLNNGSWLDLPDDLWINSDYTDQTFSVDLAPYIANMDPDLTVRFVLYGIPSDSFRIHTEHDWVALEAQSKPSIPGAMGWGTNIPPVGYQGDGTGIDNYVTCGGILEDNSQLYRGNWGEANTGVANSDHYERQVIWNGNLVYQGSTTDNYTSTFQPGSSGPNGGDGEYLVRVRAVDSDGNKSVDDTTWADTTTHTEGTTGTDGTWCPLTIDTFDKTPPEVEAFSLSDEWVTNVDDLTFDYAVSDDTELKRFKYAIWQTRGECDVEAMNNDSGTVPEECRKGEKFKRWRDDKDNLSGTYAESTDHAIDDSWKEFEDGTYFIKGRIIDEAGNKTKTQRIWFGIDSTPPDVPEDLGFNILPGDPAIPRPDVEVSCGDYTNANFEQKVAHHWTDESASGAVEYERQWMYPGESSWHGAEKWDTPYTNFRSFGGIPGIEGKWHVRVRARDAMGNWSDWSATDQSDACSVTYDQTFPVVEITNPSDGDPLRGTVNITGTIAENTELSHYNLSLYPGDADPWDFSKRIWQQHVVGDNDTVSHNLDTTAFADGEYQIRLAARDKAGNRDPMASSGDGVSVQVIRVTIDNTQPDVAFDNPLDGDLVNGVETLIATCDGGVTESRYVNFWWYKASEGQTVLGPDGAKQNHQYYLILRDNPGEGTVAGDTFSWDLDTTDDSLKSSNYDWDGVWRLRAACKDRAGNYRHTEIDVTVDNTPPEVTVDSLVTTDTTPRISGTVNDSAATVVLTIEGKTYNANVQANHTWFLPDNTVTPMAIGTHDIQATGTDLAGNTATDSTTNEVTINKEEPPAEEPTNEDDPENNENYDGEENQDSEQKSSTGTTTGTVSGISTSPVPSPVGRIGSGVSVGPSRFFARAGTIGGVSDTADEEAVEPTEDNEDDSGEVLGAEDSDIKADAAGQLENEGFLGLLKKWWFWLIVAAVAVTIYWLSRRRKKEAVEKIK